MQIKSPEVVDLESQNNKLKKNIKDLENENAELKKKVSSSKEEHREFRKIEEIKHENRRLNTSLLSLEEKHAKLLQEYEEIKHEKKDRDEKVLRLEREAESQKIELDRAYNQIETRNEIEQCKNTSTERLSKSRIESMELQSTIKNLEDQITKYQNRLSKMESKNKTLKHHNIILAKSGPISAKEAQFKDGGQSYGNNINESFSEDKREESLIDLEEVRGLLKSPALFQSFQDSHDEMMSKVPSYRQSSLYEGPLPETEKGGEIENPNTYPRDSLDFSEPCRNLRLNSQFFCFEKIGNARSEEQNSIIEGLRRATHNLVCRWIDVEINFIQVLLVFIVEAVVLIWAFLIRFLRQCQYQKWKVFGSYNFSSCESSLFSTSCLWISSLLTKTLLILHILPNGIGSYSVGQKFQCNYELINSDEPASDQGNSRTSRCSSISSMAEEEIKKINSLQHHSPNKSNLDSSAYLPYRNGPLHSASRPLSSSSNFSTYDYGTYKIGRLHGLRKSNTETAPISEPLESELSHTKLLLGIFSLLFFAPVRTGVINKRGTRSLNSDSSLPSTCDTSSQQYVFSIPSKLFKILSEISTDSFCRKSSIWLTMIEMFTHLCVYIAIYSAWLKVLQSSIPHSSYYAPTNGYSHLHGWAHQLHFSEQWASKLERFTFNMITLFGVQVKNFPIPG